ncbi:MAG: inorganic pyrophosphatase [Acholeplasmataceae bacterium]|jgi:inorganic pyrophosphatase|nr:inorganic pyrophosphatase [Acholeplasmataceae bacterium]
MNDFFVLLKQMISESEIIIDRPKSSTHPSYPDLVYMLDYGYLKGTRSADGGGIDCWLGSRGDKNLNGIIVILDGLKKEAEIKALIGCTDSEITAILAFHNQKQMKGILIRYETGNN